jgi:hypothetical protein
MAGLFYKGFICFSGFSLDANTRTNPQKPTPFSGWEYSLSEEVKGQANGKSYRVSGRAVNAGDDWL